MKFRFCVNVSEQDYLDYNIFWMLVSPYGKKQITAFRAVIAAIFGVFIFISLFTGGFSPESFIGIIPMVILLALFEIFLTKFFVWSIKGQLNYLKKKGKMGYSSSAVLEFYEDSFSETTEENKTEQKYSAIERISIVDKKIIYIHINNVMAYILPLSCFESEEQYNSFLDFIRTKCQSIDIY